MEGWRNRPWPLTKSPMLPHPRNESYMLAGAPDTIEVNAASEQEAREKFQATLRNAGCAWDIQEVKLVG